jgi:hypothetical protein
LAAADLLAEAELDLRVHPTLSDAHHRTACAKIDNELARSRPGQLRLGSD